jgi:cytochrome d ubiquinol oxidase subunit II
VLAAGAVVAVVWGWAVAQHPYILPPSLHHLRGSGPGATLKTLLGVFGVAVLFVLPSIGLLFTLVQRNLVEETSRPARGPSS